MEKLSFLVSTLNPWGGLDIEIYENLSQPLALQMCSQLFRSFGVSHVLSTGNKQKMIHLPQPTVVGGFNPSEKY